MWNYIVAWHLAAFGLAASVCGAQAASFEEVLGPPQGQLPAPMAEVKWRSDLGHAMQQARRENRPLFVTMRCLPCKQCSAFDKDVLEGGGELDPLLKQFVTVRLTDVQDVDLRLFPMEGFQDLDLSWWGWFLSPQGQVYSVFGGRDHVSDETRISVPALANTLTRVLAHHYDPRRAEWNIDGPSPELSGNAPTPKKLPGYPSWTDRTHEEVRAQTCIHCHQVAEILRQPAVDLKKFNKQEDFDVWPLPENVGLTLDRDHGLLVTKVDPGSPADQAGMLPGDELGAAGGRRLFGQADFRGVLHRGPRGAGSIDIYWTRAGKVRHDTLDLPDGWRKTVLDWRMSVSQGNVGGYPSFFPLPANNKRAERKIAAGVMAVEPYLGPKPSGPAYAAGVRGNDVVTAVGGESPDVAGRGFLVWFKMRYERGDEVTLTLKDPQGRERKVSYRLAE
jgi:serine protease Do